MAPLPRKINPFTISRADFLYKTANDTEWIRLQSPVDDLKQNCWGIYFNSGVILQQRHGGMRSMCSVKFTLKPPAIIKLDHDLNTVDTECEKFTVEAECVKIEDTRFKANADCEDEAKAIEHAKTLPLALLGKTVTAMKLRNISRNRAAHVNEHRPRDHELVAWILGTIDLGYQRMNIPPTNYSQPDQSNQLETVVPPASNGSAGPSAQTSGSQSGQNNQLSTVAPQASNSSAATFTQANGSSQPNQNRQLGTIAPPASSGSAGTVAQTSGSQSGQNNQLSTVAPQASNSSAGTFTQTNGLSHPNQNNQRGTTATPASSGSAGTVAQAHVYSQPNQKNQRGTTAPRALKGSSETFTPAANGTSNKPAPVYVDPQLEQQLQAHRIATAEGESALRRHLEHERWRLLSAISAAFNVEWNRKVEAAVKQHWVNAGSTIEKMVEKGKDN